MSAVEEMPRPRRRWLAAALVSCIALVSAAAVYGAQVLHDDHASVAARPAPVTSPAFSSPERETQVLLGTLDRAVTTGDAAGFRAGWVHAPVVQRRAAGLFTSLSRLHLKSFELRVDEGTVGGGPVWTAGLDAVWSLAGASGSPAHSALVATFRADGGRALLAGVRAGPGTHQPVWLIPDLHVQRSPRTLVAGSDLRRVQRLAPLLSHALAAVGEVLPRWDGQLVAYAPASDAEFDAMVAARPGDYTGIAAVTTTIDGSESQRVPSVVVVNPSVFDGLETISAQVVVTHEATHAATAAASVVMPLWVAEGFADYVAIGSARVPVIQAAARALDVVRREGAPETLPGAAAFAASGRALEATYEESWLASRLIAEKYGQPRLVAFYFAVERHRMSVAAAFRSLLHTTDAAFTRSWRRYLEGLANAG